MRRIELTTKNHPKNRLRAQKFPELFFVSAPLSFISSVLVTEKSRLSKATTVRKKHQQREGNYQTDGRRCKLKVCQKEIPCPKQLLSVLLLEVRQLSQQQPLWQLSRSPKTPQRKFSNICCLSDLCQADTKVTQHAEMFGIESVLSSMEVVSDTTYQASAVRFYRSSKPN